jgi:hypothetical protein
MAITREQAEQLVAKQNRGEQLTEQERTQMQEFTAAQPSIDPGFERFSVPPNVEVPAEAPPENELVDQQPVTDYAKIPFTDMEDLEPPRYQSWDWSDDKTGPSPGTLYDPVDTSAKTWESSTAELKDINKKATVTPPVPTETVPETPTTTTPKTTETSTPSDQKFGTSPDVLQKVPPKTEEGWLASIAEYNPEALERAEYMEGELFKQALESSNPNIAQQARKVRNFVASHYTERDKYKPSIIEIFEKDGNHIPSRPNAVGASSGVSEKIVREDGKFPLTMDALTYQITALKERLKGFDLDVDNPMNDAQKAAMKASLERDISKYNGIMNNLYGAEVVEASDKNPPTSGIVKNLGTYKPGTTLLVRDVETGTSKTTNRKLPDEVKRKAISESMLGAFNIDKQYGTNKMMRQILTSESKGDLQKVLKTIDDRLAKAGTDYEEKTLSSQKNQMWDRVIDSLGRIAGGLYGNVNEINVGGNMQKYEPLMDYGDQQKNIANVYGGSVTAAQEGRKNEMTSSKDMLKESLEPYKNTKDLEDRLKQMIEWSEKAGDSKVTESLKETLKTIQIRDPNAGGASSRPMPLQFKEAEQKPWDEFLKNRDAFKTRAMGAITSDKLTKQEVQSYFKMNEATVNDLWRRSEELSRSNDPDFKGLSAGSVFMKIMENLSKEPFEDSPRERANDAFRTAFGLGKNTTYDPATGTSRPAVTTGARTQPQNQQTTTPNSPVTQPETNTGGYALSQEKVNGRPVYKKDGVRYIIFKGIYEPETRWPKANTGTKTKPAQKKSLSSKVAGSIKKPVAEPAKKPTKETTANSR